MGYLKEQCEYLQNCTGSWTSDRDTVVTGVGSGGYAGDLTPQLFMLGILDIDMYIPP